MERDPASDASDSTALVTRLREVALLFTRLGFTAFGGPAAHTAMMEQEVVVRRRWIDRQHFLDLVSTLNFIPGPNSTELAIHLGQLRAGFPGLLVAGACFIGPAVLIILPLAWAYVDHGSLPSVQHLMRGVNAAVIAVIAVAAWRFAKTAVTDRFTAAVAVATLLAGVLFRHSPSLQPELIILATAALIGALRAARFNINPAALAWLPAVMGSSSQADPWMKLLKLGLVFLKVGATLFGSGYVLVSYLQSGLVDAPPHWLTQKQLLDGVAVGQVTPGPLLTTATFLGYVCGHNLFGTTAGGVTGGLLATFAIFFPSFVFVAMFSRILPRVRANRAARGALDAMNAAVVALIALVAFRLGTGALRDPLSIFLCAGAAAANLIWNVNATWTILVAALMGFAGYRGS